MARVKHTFSVTAGAVELRNEIGRMLGVDLPGTLIFDYPTISAMSAMLAAKLAPEEAAVLLKPHVRYGYLMRLLLLPHGIAISAATIWNIRHQISSVVISMVIHLDSVALTAIAREPQRWPCTRFAVLLSRLRAQNLQYLLCSLPHMRPTCLGSLSDWSWQGVSVQVHAHMQANIGHCRITSRRVCTSHCRPRHVQQASSSAAASSAPRCHQLHTP